MGYAGLLPHEKQSYESFRPYINISLSIMLKLAVFFSNVNVGDDITEMLLRSLSYVITQNPVFKNSKKVLVFLKL